MRYFIELSYNGKAYHGWQNQPNDTSVQEVIENALTKLLKENIAIVGAGRTDTGVHAKQMFAHFDTEATFNKEKLVFKLNSFLPKDVNIHDIFKCFSKSNTDVKTYHCVIMKAFWFIENDELHFTIKADRFLRNMVRAIVGTMINIGMGKMDVSELHNIIKSKDRSEAGYSVPAHALYLVEVEYPEDIRI